MKIVFFLMVLPLQVLAQDISGIWTGFIRTQGSDLSYELVITDNKNDHEKLNGYSLMVFTIGGVENLGVKSVQLKNKKGNVSLEDDEMVYNNYSTRAKHVKLYGTLSLSTVDSIMIMSGNFYTRVLDLRSSRDESYSGTIQLKRQKNSAETRLVKQLEELNLLSSFSFIPPKTKPVEKKEPEKVAVVTPPVSVPEEKTKDAQHPSSKEPLVFLEPKPDGKQKHIDNYRPKEPDRTVQAPVILISKVTSPPVTVIKQPEPVKLKEKPIDSSSLKLADNKIKPVEEPRPKVVIKKEEPVINAAAKIDQRKTEIIRNVFFRADSLTLSLYDNGTVDGDTVSVVLNGKVIIARKGLSENAIRVVVQMTPDMGDSLLLTMYAENLGSIPPNTGLLIIQDGNERNEIRFEGDLQKSSAVILRRRR